MFRILIAFYLLIASSFSHSVGLADGAQYQLNVDVQVTQVVETNPPLSVLLDHNLEKPHTGLEYAKRQYQVLQTIVDKLKFYQQKVQQVIYHQQSVSKQLPSVKRYQTYLIQLFESEAEPFVFLTH